MSRPARAVALTLGLAAIGALGFQALGLPAPFLTGPATLVTAASLAGLATRIPDRLRDAVFLVIGVGIGATVTPETLGTAIDWPLSFLALAVSLAVSLMVARRFLERVCGYDRRDAVLAATPGHLSYALSLSEDTGAGSGRIALVQSMRVLFLTLLVPLLLTLWGREAGPPPPSGPAMPALTVGLLMLGGLVAGLVLKRANVPAALLLGGMGVSSVCHATEVTMGGLPGPTGPAAFAVMGALIGTRFAGHSAREMAASLRAGAGVTLILCGVAGAGALAVSALLGLSPALLLISFAPGGVEAMAAMAILIGAEPAFVAAHHVFRLMILLVLIPVFLRDGKKPR